MREGCERFPAAAPKGAAGTGGSVPVGELFRVATTAIGRLRRPRCDRHHRRRFLREDFCGRPRKRSQEHCCAPGACEMGVGIAANPHYPVSPCAALRAVSLHRPFGQGTATRRCRWRRNDPAMVRSAPLRGPASPGKPFIILSESLPKQSLFRSDGLRFLSDRVHLNSWESRRSVIGYRSMSSSVRSVSVRLVLQPPFGFR